MKHVWTWLLIIIVFVMQAKVSLFGAPLAFTTALAFYFGINNKPVKGMIIGSLIGIAEDSIAGVMLGPNMLGKGMVGFFSSFMSGTLFRWTPLLGMIWLSVLTVMDGLIVLLSNLLSGMSQISSGKALITLIIQGGVNALLGIFVRPKNAE